VVKVTLQMAQVELCVKVGGFSSLTQTLRNKVMPLRKHFEDPIA